MRTFFPSRPSLVGALLVLVGFASDAFAVAPPGDFNPDGRRPPRTQPGTATRRPSSATEQGPGTDALIKRYTGIVMARPEEAFPLRRLADLYRKRDGNLTQLVSELQQRMQAGGSDGWAAKVALAGIHRIDDRTQEAIQLYEEAIQARPDAIGVTRALAEALFDAGELERARSAYEKVFSKTTDRVDKESAIRTLVQIALDQKDFSGAKTYHEQLVRLAQGSIFVRGELGRELLQRGHHALAEAEVRDVVKAAAGDNRALAPALRDLGQILVRQGKSVEAIEVLRKAQRIAGQAAGVRREIHSLITEAYRAEGRLPEYITQLESSGTNDFEEVVTLGLLLEEVGQVDRALDAYRRALRLNQRHIDTRLKVIHLLQAKGELEEAIREYEALIRSVPNNPEFTFELCEILIQRGDRAKALTLLTRLEQHTRDDDQFGRLADFYERIEESERAMRILQRLAASGVGDPRYIIDLGDRYYQQGDKKKALETWARLKVLLPNRAQAQAALADVYLDHDMPAEGVAALREAVKLEPKNLRFLKSLAVALERTAAATSRRRTLTGDYLEALQLWESILQLAHDSGDEGQAREARLHIVTIWALSNQLAAQLEPLAGRFEAKPPDVQAGRMLSEVQVRLRRLPDAEKTLTKLGQLRPGEPEIFLSLERVHVLQRKLPKAIEVLEKLVEIDPKRARQYYQRMAQYAAELYRDEDAVTYAARAVALAPDDAEGHRKLGEMYRRRQDNERAIAQFRAAIAKNDRLYLVYFDLAELLLTQGQNDEADQLYRRVVRTCPDEEMIARAARLSMQLNLGKGGLEVLERELLPAALGNPQKKVYRRLLVDLYGAMAFPLVQSVRHGSEQEAASARKQLEKIGTRAVKPLLDALADDNQGQQLIAIELLAFVQNRSAAPALFAFATGQADLDLRVRAMVACGALTDPGMVSRYSSLLTNRQESAVAVGGPVSVAAAWGVARMADASVRPLLRELSGPGAPDIRALALLGLGLSKDPQAAKVLSDVVKSSEAGNLARAAGALGLGELGAKHESKTLIALAQSQDSLLRETALIALARLAPEQAKPLIANALFDPSPTLRKAALQATLVVATGQFKRKTDPWQVPDGFIDVRGIIDASQPSGYTQADKARALIVFEKHTEAAALQAAQTSSERALRVADALLSRGKEPGLAPFSDELDNVDSPLKAQAMEAAARITENVAPSFVALVHHPSPNMRIRAIRMIARQSMTTNQQLLIDALQDQDESVQRAAVVVLGEHASQQSVDALCALLEDNPTWSLRVRAADALGLLPLDRVSDNVVAVLSRVARKDDYALVRQAALTSLASVAASSAKPVLDEAAAKDDEPAIRALAQKLLEKT